MIQGMKLNNVNCVLDRNSIMDNEDGFYHYHTEQWSLYNDDDYIGCVMFMETLPLVTRNRERYEMKVFTAPEDELKSQGYDKLHKPKSRISLLKSAINNYINN